jgi:hypothetical protein
MRRAIGGRLRFFPRHFTGRVVRVDSTMAAQRAAETAAAELSMSP